MLGKLDHCKFEVPAEDLDSVVAAKGLFTGAVATGVLGFITAILFLFCTPSFDVLFALDAPQPFVQIYAQALGRGGAVFMSILAILGLVLVSLKSASTQILISFFRILVSLLLQLHGLYLQSRVTAFYPCLGGLDK